MKNEKFTVKAIKKMLSRDEMKKVVAGSSFCQTLDCIPDVWMTNCMGAFCGGCMHLYGNPANPYKCF